MVVRSGARVTIRHSSITRNLGGYGSAFQVKGTLVLDHVTVSDNDSPQGMFGAILVDGGTLIARNSIIWGNATARDGETIYRDPASPGSVTIAYTDVEGGWKGTGNIDADPRFDDQYVLRAGSPAIDAGDPASPRDPDGSRTDLGAFTSSFSRPTGIALTSGPKSFALQQNSPNPFNPTTAIRFSLAAGSDVELAVFTSAGQRVRTLVAGDIGAGAHEIAWDGTDDGGRPVASGTYLYRLATDEGTVVKRMTCVR